MFDLRPRRQVPERLPLMQRRYVREQQVTPKRNFMAIIQDSDGNINLEKITTTAHQINQIYHQVSPLISRFIKK